jgi:hypothetical protein
VHPRGVLVGAGFVAAFLLARSRAGARSANAAGAATGAGVNGSRMPGRYPLPEADADAFYADVLLVLGMPATANRLRFMRAWRQAEGAEASWNPWNTTWARGRVSKYNTVGVGNYATRADGLLASSGTLRLRYYTDLRARLARDDAPELVALSPDLRTWGTGAGVSRVLSAFPGAIPYRSPLFGV